MTNPKTVLMTADTVGGVFFYAVELCRAYRAKGIRVVLATLGSPLSPSQWEQLCALDNVEVHESGYRLEWMPDPWDDVRRAGEWLLELEARTAPDVIHANSYTHGSLNWSAPAIVVGHSCVLSWWKSVKNTDAPVEWGRYRHEVTRGLRAAALVAAPSQSMLSWLDRLYGPLPRSVVIPNSRCWRSSPAPKQPFIFTAGRLWDEAKNIRLLESAAPELPWPVHAAGSGCQRGSDNFYALGQLSEASLAQWMSAAAIYALPALYEPFGLSVLEAALSGCALVLGDIDSLREHWDGAAVFADPRDDQAWVHHLTLLARSPGRRERLGSAARAAAARFTPELTAAHYLRAYSLAMQSTRSWSCAS